MSDPAVRIDSSPKHKLSHDRDGHVVQLYTEDGFLIDVLGRFVGGALAVGDAAVVIATASHRVDLEKLLSARGIDLSKAASLGRYTALDRSLASDR